MLKLVAASLFLCAATVPSHACGVSSDCKLSLPDGERTYRIAMPDAADGKPSAVIFAHGYRGTAAGSMRNKGVINALNERGVAYVAAQAGDQDWQLHNRPRRGPNVEGQKREMAYFEAIKTDLVANHGIDGDNIMVSGFSAGGMVAWTIACELGDTFAAYAPIAGTFWKPVPQSCAALPVPMIHIHGTADRTVPLKGRAIADSAQGNVYNALELMSDAGGYGKWASIGERAGLTCQEKAGSGAAFLQFCLHDGGHSFRSEWMGETWDAFVEKGVLRSTKPGKG